MVNRSTRLQRGPLKKKTTAVAARTSSHAEQPCADGPAKTSSPQTNSIKNVEMTVGVHASPAVAVGDTPQGKLRLRRRAKKERPLVAAKTDMKSTVRNRKRGRARGSQPGRESTATTIVHDEQRATRRPAGGNRQRNQHRQVAEKLVAREEHQSRKKAAEKRMETAKAELALFDQVMQIPSFEENPFAAIEGHLNGTMAFLQPQTPDVGRRKLEE
ncbi:hypothetical protein TcCL_NonESM03330 [Trypanosoma cruzi]|nr:hypothetical protein TcCL_NonESM03330 [Trypanosoma cruzi]